MNKMRRKEIDKVISLIEEAKSMTEYIMSEEEDYRDNMPENLQGSMKYDAAEEAIDNMQDAIDSLEEAIDSLNEAQM